VICSSGSDGDTRLTVAVGAGSSLVAILGSWVPSLWGDEAASIMSARRDWSSLAGMLGTVDAVHGLYYAFLHVWIDLVGASPFAVRLPSGLAVGAASAGLFLLVRRRADRMLALVAAVVFAVMPRVTFLATEARSLALATAAVVWLTLLLLRLLDDPSARGWWVLYTIGMAAGAYLFLHVALLIVVHGVVVFAELRRRPPGGTASGRTGAGFGPFALAWAAAAALAAPMAVIAVHQREQIAFREHRDEVSLASVLVMPWFVAVPLAVAAFGIIACGLIGAVVHRHDDDWRGQRALLVLATAWVVIPTAALLAITALFTPVFTPRYLALAAPGIAILTAIGVSALPRRWPRIVAISALVGLAVPTFVDQRTSYAKNGGTDWQAVAAVIEVVAEPGDGIVFDEQVRPSRRPRLAMYTYPEAFRGLVDLTLVRRHHETNGLWDVTAPLAAVPERLDGLDRVIVVSRSRHGVEADVAVLRREGFELVERLSLASDVVTVFERVMDPAPVDPVRAAALASSDPGILDV
jgi:mannosyltransferase